MLPIRDPRGRVIAFGGRLIEAQEGAPKYLNSPDTPFVRQGPHPVQPRSRRTGGTQGGRLIVVEGYMDVVALANAGIDEAVAPMGTALTETQIELLWRHAECPVLCLDGDSAGRRAALRAAARALPLLKPGHTLSVARCRQVKIPTICCGWMAGTAWKRSSLCRAAYRVAVAGRARCRASQHAGSQGRA
jgi:DNA primase